MPPKQRFGGIVISGVEHEARAGTAAPCRGSHLCHPRDSESGESGRMDRVFKKSAGRSYFLVDENDEVESFSSLDELIETVRGLGIKFAEIHM
jgi:hypothetical protein